MPETIILQRLFSCDQGTFGVIVHDYFGCFTLEPPWRNNRRNRSCIPTGEYHCHWHQSPSKGWVYKLAEVTGRRNILIHPGNWAGDKNKGFISNSDGCILLGKQQGTIHNQMAVTQSRNTIKHFGDLMNKSDFILHILNPKEQQNE